MTTLRYITHPNVVQDPEVPVPQWGLSELGRQRAEAMARQPWAATIGRVVSSPETKAREAAEVLAGALGLAVEVRHESFANSEFVDMARSHGVSIITAADSEFPQIADQTAPFVYMRLQGTAESEVLGYSPDDLDVWAKAIKAWAAGEMPDGLRYIADPSSGVSGGRDVFFYVIAGAKAKNPSAAMALIDRVG